MLFELAVADNTLSNETVTATSPVGLLVPLDYDDACLTATLSCADAGTSNTVFTVVGSNDGRNWDIATALGTVTVANSGTSTVTGHGVITNVGTLYMGLYSIATTQTNLVTVDSVKVVFRKLE